MRPAGERPAGVRDEEPHVGGVPEEGGQGQPPLSPAHNRKALVEWETRNKQKHCYENSLGFIIKTLPYLSILY